MLRLLAFPAILLFAASAFAQSEPLEEWLHKQTPEAAIGSPKLGWSYDVDRPWHESKPVVSPATSQPSYPNKTSSSSRTATSRIEREESRHHDFAVEAGGTFFGKVGIGGSARRARALIEREDSRTVYFIYEGYKVVQRDDLPLASPLEPGAVTHIQHDTIRELFDFCGTHYVSSIYRGGRVFVTLRAHSRATWTADQIKNAIKLSINFPMAGGNTSYSGTETIKQSLNDVEFELYLDGEGGDSNILTKRAFAPQNAAEIDAALKDVGELSAAYLTSVDNSRAITLGFSGRKWSAIDAGDKVLNAKLKQLTPAPSNEKNLEALAGIYKRYLWAADRANECDGYVWSLPAGSKNRKTLEAQKFVFQRFRDALQHHVDEWYKQLVASRNASLHAPDAVVQVSKDIADDAGMPTRTRNGNLEILLSDPPTPVLLEERTRSLTRIVLVFEQFNVSSDDIIAMRNPYGDNAIRVKIQKAPNDPNPIETTLPLGYIRSEGPIALGVPIRLTLDPAWHSVAVSFVYHAGGQDIPEVLRNPVGGNFTIWRDQFHAMADLSHETRLSLEKALEFTKIPEPNDDYIFRGRLQYRFAVDSK